MRTKGGNHINLSKQPQNLPTSVKKGKFSMNKENLKKTGEILMKLGKGSKIKP